MLKQFQFFAIFLCLSLLAIALLSRLPETAAENREAPAQVLRHVVLFQFKDSATAAQIREIETAFCRLPSSTGLIRDFEWGTNVSPEGLDHGHTHCFILTFNSEADRDSYLPHPDHKAFGELLGPCLEQVTVVDYWTKP
ncbi:MAG TPA: Dabb family protein [Candidatus Hydrogenedentes bacterium]|jgi:hypothetical protein|nr:Dabb family protein [Candidatus Hydrogenedentota bacterium]HQB01743.1 Dabb family protein [Candidatus Hydrogenedentota bacterium]